MTIVQLRKELKERIEDTDIAIDNIQKETFDIRLLDIAIEKKNKKIAYLENRKTTLQEILDLIGDE